MQTTIAAQNTKLQYNQQVYDEFLKKVKNGFNIAIKATISTFRRI